MLNSVLGVTSGQWAKIDGESPIRSEVHVDAVQFSFGDGGVEMLFTPLALEKLLSEGQEALRLINEQVNEQRSPA